MSFAQSDLLRAMGSSDVHALDDHKGNCLFRSYILQCLIYAVECLSDAWVGFKEEVS